MKYIKSLILLFTVGLAFGQKGESISISIEEAISLALQNNATIKNASLDIKFAESQVNEIKAQGLPQVNGNFGFTHNYKVPTSIIPGEVIGQPGTTVPVQFGVPFNIQAGVGVRQLLFDGTFFLGLQAASEFVNISRLSASKSELDIKEAVIKAYYMSIISDQNVSQLYKSLKNINKLKDETQAMYDAGFAEKLDVDRLELSLSNLEVSINQLQNQAKLAKQLLLNSIGLDVNQDVFLTSALPSEETALVTLSSTFNPENRIEMKILNQQQEINQLNLKRYKVGYLPSLFGNFSYGGNTFAPEGSFNTLGDDWFGLGSYGLSLNVSIFDGLYKKAKLDQVKIDMQKTENTKQQTILGLNLQVNQAKTNYMNALESIDIQKKSQELAESIYNTTSIKFKEGIGSSFEMINAESELTSARTNYLNALYELNIAQLELHKALGTL